MKKYSAIVENGYVDLVPDNNGDYVHASVAQSLYDALRQLTASHQDFMECAINPELGTPDIEWSREIENQALEALSLADCEE